MLTGPGPAVEVLQAGMTPTKKPSVVQGPGANAGGGVATEMQAEKTPDEVIDPLAEQAKAQSATAAPEVVTLEMLPDADLLAVAKVTLEKLPKPDKETGEISRDDLIAALQAAGVTEFEAS